MIQAQRRGESSSESCSILNPMQASFPIRVSKSQHCLILPALPAGVALLQWLWPKEAVEQRWAGFASGVSKLKVHVSHPSGKLHIAIVLGMLKSGYHSNRRRKLRVFIRNKKPVMGNLCSFLKCLSRFKTRVKFKLGL